MSENQEILMLDRPSKYSFNCSLPVWAPPCYVGVPISVRREDGSSGFLEFADLGMFVDSYAKAPLERQFEHEWSRRASGFGGPHRDAWIRFWLEQHARFKGCFLETKPAGLAGGAPRQRVEFRIASLEEVVQRRAESVFAYVVAETIFESKHRTREDSRFRIHTRPDVPLTDAPYLFLDRRIPWRLHDEDIVPWFRAMLLNLPKRKQPRDISSWLQRFQEPHPNVRSHSPPRGGSSWSCKQRIALIFGEEWQVGYAPIYHLESSRPCRFCRQCTVLSVEGEELFEGDMEIPHRFFIFTPDEASAELLERELIHGSRKYVGLGSRVTGLISAGASDILSIGVDDAAVKRHCDRPKLVLVLKSKPRHRLRHYVYEDQRLPA